MSSIISSSKPRLLRPKPVWVTRLLLWWWQFLILFVCFLFTSCRWVGVPRVQRRDSSIAVGLLHLIGYLLPEWGEGHQYPAKNQAIAGWRQAECNCRNDRPSEITVRTAAESRVTCPWLRRLSLKPSYWKKEKIFCSRWWVNVEQPRMTWWFGTGLDVPDLCANPIRFFKWRWKCRWFYLNITWRRTHRLCLYTYRVYHCLSISYCPCLFVLTSN